MPQDLDQARIFDVNGTKYRVGIDHHGYVAIQVGEMWEGEITESGEAEFHAYDADAGLRPVIQADKHTALEMAEHIEEIAG